MSINRLLYLCEIIDIDIDLVYYFSNLFFH
jgi:hypothetical protein